MTQKRLNDHDEAMTGREEQRNDPLTRAQIDREQAEADARARIAEGPGRCR